jgi:RNA polymerase sigma factor FliA
MKPKDPAVLRAESVIEMVRQLARRIAMRKRMTADDLVGVGNEAAILAAREFDEARGVPWGAFAFNKIRWAMLDAARVERRSQTSYADRTPPVAVDLEMALQDTPETVRARTHAWVEEHVIEITLKVNWDGIDRQNPEELANEHRILGAVREGLDGLPDDERVFAKRFYADEKTEVEIAAELGVSRRTAQRIHKSLKDRLAKRLRRSGTTSTSELND